MQQRRGSRTACVVGRQRTAVNRPRSADEAGRGRLHEEEDSLPVVPCRPVILSEREESFKQEILRFVQDDGMEAQGDG